MCKIDTECPHNFCMAIGVTYDEKKDKGIIKSRCLVCDDIIERVLHFSEGDDRTSNGS